MEVIIEGFLSAFTLNNIFFIVAGVVLGLLIGVVPGINGPMGIALCIPLTYYMSPISAIAFLVGINKGSCFGGAIPSILLNTPGVPESTATTFDGYPLTQKGQGEKALRMSLYSSVFGDTFSDIVLILVAAPLALVALYMGPPEIFALVVLALTVIAGVESESLSKGLITAAFGVLVSCVGIEAVSALPRLTLGLFQLESGISLVVIAIGMLAVAEIIIQLETRLQLKQPIQLSKNPEDRFLSWNEFKSCLPTIIRSSCIGTGVGAMPGIGAPVAAFLAYGQAKKYSKHPEEFGKGSLEGVAAPEAATNAVVGANLIPLFTLGIPGNLAAALLVGAFVIHGITPGPLIFEQNAVLIYGIFASMLMACGVLLFVGQIGLRVFVRVVEVPLPILYPVIFFTCLMGAYMASGSIFGVKVMLVFAIIGYAMKKLKFSFVCFLIGFILGPMLEVSLQQIVISSEQNPYLMLTRPVALGLLAITLYVVARIAFKTYKDR